MAEATVPADGSRHQPVELTPAQALSSLDLSQPNDIGRLASLTSLSLKGTGISEIPTSLSSLTGLQDLDVSYNSLSTLPPSMSRLKHLR